MVAGPFAAHGNVRMEEAPRWCADWGCAVKATREESPIKAVIDGRKYPPSFYRLPNDTRKWREQCQKRRMLAIQIASYANPDGSNVTIGIPRLMQELGASKATIHRWLDDLYALPILFDEVDEAGRAREGQHGTRRRRIDFSAFEKRLEVSDRGTLEVSDSTSNSQIAFSKSQIQIIKVSDSVLDVSDSTLEVSRMGETEPYRPNQPTFQPVRPANAAGGIDSLKPSASCPESGRDLEAKEESRKKAEAFFKKYDATMGKPSERIRFQIEALAGKEGGEHAWELMDFVMYRFEGRPQGLGGLRYPWNQFLKDAPTTIAAVKEESSWRGKYDPVYQRHIEECIRRQKEEFNKSFERPAAEPLPPLPEGELF